MRILYLMRFPGIFIALSCVMTGFYTASFSGVGIDKVGFLPQMSICGIFLVIGSAIWNELFTVADSAKAGDAIPVQNVSMGLAYILGCFSFIIALMLSMTVSFLSFFTAALYIFICLCFNALIRKIPGFEGVFFALQYILLLVLGLSAHPYIIYLITDPGIYFPVASLFLYILVLRIIKNVPVRTAVSEPAAKEREEDVEMESLELSTEIDPVYEGNTDAIRNMDYTAACNISNRMIKRNLSVILPDKSEDFLPKKILYTNETLIDSLWLEYFAFAVLILIPAMMLYIMNALTVITLSVLGVCIVFLLFPLFKVIRKKSVAVAGELYRDGIVSISIINILILVSSISDIFHNRVMTVLGIQLCIFIILLILKKHFPKIV